jgi:hypothetical protein
MSESRIKTFRLNVALRHEDINPHAVLSQIVKRRVYSEQFVNLTEGKIEISLEDSIEKRELENFL